MAQTGLVTAYRLERDCADPRHGRHGTLGRRLVPRLVDAGLAVRVLSRREHGARDGVEHAVGDLVTGVGVDAAVDDVGVIVHCATGRTGDVDAARCLLAAAKAQPVVPHLVYISIVGIDRVPVVSRVDRALFGYYATKVSVERLIAESGVPWTTLRTTQFHDLLLMGASAVAKLPLVPVPSGFHFQPIDADEVAVRLVELALGPPAGRVADMGGPEVLSAADLARSYLRAVGRRRPVVSVRLPGRAARAYRDGANLTPDHAVGTRTWQAFLASHRPQT